MGRQNLRDGYSNIVMEFCEHCMFDTRTRVTISKTEATTVRSTTELDYVHSDLWSPIGVSSRDGLGYVMTLIDYYSLMVSAYFLKYDEEVFSTFVA